MFSSLFLLHISASKFVREIYIFKAISRTLKCPRNHLFLIQINAKTELAKRYKDLSPLENHHCSVMFNILSNPDSNIFINLSQDQFIQVRAVGSK